MIALVALVLAIAALIFGIVAVVQSNGRSWAGWGVICLAVLELVTSKLAGL